MATEITNDDIATAALEPAEAEADGTKAQNRSIDELIKAQQHAATNRAVAGNASAWGLTRPARAVPPGSI